VAIDGVFQAFQGRGSLARGTAGQEAPVARQDPVRGAVPQRQRGQVPLGRHGPAYENEEAKAFGFYPQKGLFEEYASFGRGHGHDLAPFDQYHKVRGMRWPVVNGKETLWRYREGSDPYVKAGTGYQFYGNIDGKANIFALPYEPPAEAPDKDYPFWLSTGRVLSTGTQIHDPAYPSCIVPCLTHCATCIPDDDAMGCAPRQRSGCLAARLHAHARRDPRPQQATARIGLCVPWFDASQLINKVTLDATDPISLQTDEVRCEDHQGLTKRG
jgi:nitrate reductase NapA